MKAVANPKRITIFSFTLAQTETLFLSRPNSNLLKGWSCAQLKYIPWHILTIKLDTKNYDIKNDIR